MGCGLRAGAVPGEPEAVEVGGGPGTVSCLVLATSVRVFARGGVWRERGGLEPAARQ